ncbi:MAG TPA: hypothetical protein VGM24_10710, partial [Puia sp.]
MEKRISELFKKYLSNHCTVEEMDEFFHYIRQSRSDEPLRKLIRDTYQAIRNEPETYVDHTGELFIPQAGEGAPPVFPDAVRIPGKKKLARWMVAAGILSGISIGALYFSKTSSAALTENARLAL